MFWKLARVPEPEVMDDSAEVESYASAAAARHLDAIDNTFVEHLLRLLPREMATERNDIDMSFRRHRETLVQKTRNRDIEGQGTQALSSFERGLDVGTGPAQIPIKILTRIPRLAFIGLDRSRTMLASARRNAEKAAVSERLALLIGDGHSLPFPDHVFAMVICNSVLHHARTPVELLQELFRVAAPGAPVLVRDLRRPARPLLRWHLWRHGRRYEGLMRQLFHDSVRAAYTLDELQGFLDQVHESGARAFRFHGAHIGIERTGREQGIGNREQKEGEGV
jgi:ubiquinone/menaquinone biosynthesis C-methylase UbiE